MPKTKVFISWSQPRSKQIAEYLQQWLPAIIQSLDPFISTQIPVGSAWSRHILTELKATNIGIICCTPENQREPWLNFEAGAIAKNDGLVCLYLHDLPKANLAPPLSMFQAVIADRDGTRQLLFDLLAFVPDSPSTTAVSRLFDKLWDELETFLSKLPTGEPAQKRSTDEMLQELLGLARSQNILVPDVTKQVKRSLARERANKREALNRLEREVAEIERLRATLSPDEYDAIEAQERYDGLQARIDAMMNESPALLFDGEDLS